MYTDGLQIGDNAFLLNNDDELMLATIKGTKEAMEEYIKTSNQYDEKIEEKCYLIDKLSEVHYKEKKARKIDIETFLGTILIEGLFLIMSIMIGYFPIDILILVPTVCIGIGIILKFEFCGTKKKRNSQKEKLSIEISKTKEELKELKSKIEILKNKMEYSEVVMDKDEIITITTVDNKKANVKMRVLKLEQNR